VNRPGNEVFRVRSDLALTQEAMGKALGYSRNYVHMLEAGLKPITPQVRKRLAAIAAHPDGGLAPGAALQLRERGAVYPATGECPPAPLCRFPADCDLVARLDRMETQMQTLVQLLGATLAASSPAAAPAERKKAG
jgi:transcriptional regulator with XRE-family HTH domain